MASGCRLWRSRARSAPTKIEASAWTRQIGRSGPNQRGPSESNSSTRVVRSGRSGDAGPDGPGDGLAHLFHLDMLPASGRRSSTGGRRAGEISGRSSASVRSPAPSPRVRRAGGGPHLRSASGHRSARRAAPGRRGRRGPALDRAGRGRGAHAAMGPAGGRGVLAGLHRHARRPVAVLPPAHPAVPPRHLAVPVVRHRAGRQLPGPAGLAPGGGDGGLPVRDPAGCRCSSSVPSVRSSPARWPTSSTTCRRGSPRCRTSSTATSRRRSTSAT